MAWKRSGVRIPYAPPHAQGSNPCHLGWFRFGPCFCLGPRLGRWRWSGDRGAFRRAVVLDAELVVFVDVDLGEEGLVAEASVGVVAAFVEHRRRWRNASSLPLSKASTMASSSRRWVSIPMGQCRPPGTRPTASMRPPEARPHRRRRARGRSDGSFTRRAGLERTIDFRHEGNVTSNCSATELTAGGVSVPPARARRKLWVGLTVLLLMRATGAGRARVRRPTKGFHLV